MARKVMPKMVRIMRTGERLANSRGFTLIWVVIAIAVIATALAITGSVWEMDVRRAREAAMIRNAMQYVFAIEDYYRRSPGSVPQLPVDEKQLILDARYVGVVRHLRKLYPDPTNGGAPFRYIRDVNDRIVGVASDSDGEPVLKTTWTDGVHTLPVAAHYREWKFLAVVSP